MSHSIRDSGEPATQTAAGTGRQPMDMIFIDGLVGQTVIGIHDAELHVPQTIRIDLQAGQARSRACDTDLIGDTIDYGVVRARLLQLMAEHKLRLLEAFAETIADILIDEFGAAWVRVRVTKPRKFEDVEAVGVQIERMALHEPLREPQRKAPGDDATASPSTRQAAVLHLLASGMVPRKI